VQLKGRAIELREYQIEDAEAVVAWTSDPEVVRHLTWDVGDYTSAMGFVERTIAQAREQPRSIYEFAMIERASGMVVGSAGLRVRDRRHQRADLGYVLRRDRWGRGYMTESVKLLLAFGFKLGMHRIEATCRPENQASAKVLEKAGLSFEGRMREVQYVRGEWWDALLFAALPVQP
jgi:ribosomal-protein-alanine N-acetyltransferase